MPEIPDISADFIGHRIGKARQEIEDEMQKGFDAVHQRLDDGFAHLGERLNALSQSHAETREVVRKLDDRVEQSVVPNIQGLREFRAAAERDLYHLDRGAQVRQSSVVQRVLNGNGGVTLKFNPDAKTILAILGALVTAVLLVLKGMGLV